MNERLIEHCFDHGTPFAMVIPPGLSWTDARWYAPATERTEADTPSGFAVRPFCLVPDTPLVWMSLTTPAALCAHRLGGGPSPARPLTFVSTPDTAYRAQARAIIDSLRTNGGKTVLSRLLTAQSERPLSEVIRDYFELFPDTLRYVYLCDETGLWFGASPELLLDYDASTQQLRTMSLAGTRKIGHNDTPSGSTGRGRPSTQSVDAPPSPHKISPAGSTGRGRPSPQSVDGAQPQSGEVWDAKNLAEHQYVTDYIIESLRQHGLEPVITDSTPLRFGEIEHLCDRIAATGRVDPVILADTLSPTPALCGYPKERAYRQILATELHPRLYYGGWVAIREGSRFLAHVNLRCAQVLLPSPSALSHGARCISAEGQPLLYALYVGGGLTADSDVETELTETQAKAKTLMNCITKNGEY